MLHGPHPVGIDQLLHQLPAELRLDVDHGLRACDAGADNYTIALLLLLQVGPSDFARYATPSHWRDTPTMSVVRNVDDDAEMDLNESGEHCARYP